MFDVPIIYKKHIVNTYDPSIVSLDKLYDELHVDEWETIDLDDVERNLGYNEEEYMSITNDNIKTGECMIQTKYNLEKYISVDELFKMIVNFKLNCSHKRFSVSSLLEYTTLNKYLYKMIIKNTLEEVVKNQIIINNQKIVRLGPYSYSLVDVLVNN